MNGNSMMNGQGMASVNMNGQIMNGQFIPNTPENCQTQEMMSGQPHMVNVNGQMMMMMPVQQSQMMQPQAPMGQMGPMGQMNQPMGGPQMMQPMMQPMMDQPLEASQQMD